MTNPADIPTPLPWDQRAKGVGSMPGGYTGYVQALRQICEHVVSEGPSRTDLVVWIQGHFDLSGGSATWRERFLHKAGVLEFSASQIRLSEHASRWYVGSDDGILIGLLHSRLQYFGEMLSELHEGPRSLEELRQAAEKYNLNWDTDNQGHRRRGWLESAKLVEPDGKDRLAITDAGRSLLSMLKLHRPALDEEHTDRNPPATPSPSGVTNLPARTATTDQQPMPEQPFPGEVLADEIRSASTDSKNPDRLEIAVRDAFKFLGFDAEKLGGSGKTDVLVKAPLGKDDSYTATIDAKTVGAGSLGDGQVDWVTLEEHRKQHNADYSMLIGPNPSGKRLMNRAVDQAVAVLSTEQLADLCIQHARAPLSLKDYRALFEAGGVVDTNSIDRAAKDWVRLRDLAVELCEKLTERTGTFGPLTASQLMVMIDQPDKSSSVEEIQQTLDTLASPLVGVIQGTASGGYVLATAPRVIQQRLQQLGDQIAR